VDTEISAALTERRAVRAYKPDAVPDELVREILAEARWAPSATNTQSTYVYVLSGELLAELQGESEEYAESEAPANPDLARTCPCPPLPGAAAGPVPDPDVVRGGRRGEDGRQAAPASDQPHGGGGADLRAPIVLALAFDKASRALRLFRRRAARHVHHARGAPPGGWAPCITGSNVRYPDLLRKVIPGTENQNFVVAISLGYPKWDAAGQPLPADPHPGGRVREVHPVGGHAFAGAVMTQTRKEPHKKKRLERLDKWPAGSDHGSSRPRYRLLGRYCGI